MEVESAKELELKKNYDMTIGLFVGRLTLFICLQEGIHLWELHFKCNSGSVWGRHKHHHEE